MRKKGKIIIWPVYFDGTKTRGEGRRVSKSLAMPSPKISEIKEAAEKLDLNYEVVPDVCYPKIPWLKTGMLLVEKEEPKEKTISRIGKQLSKIRKEATRK